MIILHYIIRALQITTLAFLTALLAIVFGLDWLEKKITGKSYYG